MVFNNRIKEIQTIIYDASKIVFDSIARFLGYPDVPGMPIFPLDSKFKNRTFYLWKKRLFFNEKKT